MYVCVCVARERNATNMFVCMGNNLTKLPRYSREVIHDHASNTIKQLGEWKRYPQEGGFLAAILSSLHGNHCRGLHLLTIKHIVKHILVARNGAISPLFTLVERWLRTAASDILGIPSSNLPLGTTYEILPEHLMSCTVLSCETTPLKFVKRGGIARVGGVRRNGIYRYYRGLPAHNYPLMNSILRQILHSQTRTLMAMVRRDKVAHGLGRIYPP
mmetsp:Transcript_201/g.425  ORF Transcript_201/g.425 Transcript_201/m.425 type:complete len:215 (+) Transcript_201:80-724(+)